jgi:hypothetical protein
MAFKSGMQTVVDNRAQMDAALAYLRDTKLMIGIPEDKDPRDDGPAGNAVIGYVQEHGDPSRNLPPRPFLVPGVNKMQDAIASSTAAAGRAALEGDQSEVKAIMGRLGSRCVTSVKDVITDQQFTPLAPRTVLARLAKLGKKARVDLAFDLTAGRTTMADIASGASDYIKILQDTNSMFNAITYVFRRKGVDQ